MNSMHISYTSVFHFLVVAKHMNMTKAAEELFITQAALSQSIAKLEGNLGLTLFYRDKKKLVLTPEAEALLPFFEEFRQAHDTLATAVDNLTRNPEQIVNVGFVGSAYVFSALYYSNLLRQYRKGNKMRFAFLTDSMGLNLLLASQLDLVVSSVSLRDPLISSIVLSEKPIGVLMPGSHPRVRKEQITCSDLEKLRFFGLSGSHSFRQLCDEICRNQQLSLRYISEDNYAEYRHRLLEAPVDPVGCFLSTEDNFNTYLKDTGRFVFRPIAGDAFRSKICLYFRAGDKKEYRYRDLIELLREALVQSSPLAYHFSDLIHSQFQNT